MTKIILALMKEDTVTQETELLQYIEFDNHREAQLTYNLIAEMIREKGAKLIRDS